MLTRSCCAEQLRAWPPFVRSFEIKWKWYPGTLKELEYFGDQRHEKVIRPVPYASRSLIYFAVENDHLAIKPFKSAEAKVTVFQKGRRRNGTGIDTLDQSS